MHKIKLLIFILAIIFCQGAAFTIDPAKNAVWHNEKGLFYLEMKYYIAAIKEFQLAIKLNPESEVSATFYNNLGMTYHKINNYHGAEIYFKKAIELKPYYLDFRKNLIEVYKKENILNEKADYYNQLIIKDPKDLESYIMLGLIHKNYGNKDYAVMYFNKFLQLAPEFGVSRQIKEIIKNLKTKNS